MTATKMKSTIREGSFKIPRPNKMSFFFKLFLLSLNILQFQFINAIYIRNPDFDNFVKPCFGFGTSYPQSSSYSQSSAYAYNNRQPVASMQPQQQFRTDDRNSYRTQTQFSVNGNPTFDATQKSNTNSLETFSANNILGQEVPRGQTIDNFISIVTKIEAAHPRLSNNLDQFIRALLGRFHYDDVYFDKQGSKKENGNDKRFGDISSAMLNPPGFQTQEIIPEHILDQPEKCSMYFMLSHFIEKSSPLNPSLARSVTPISGPQNGVKPPYLQASGANYPSRSANSAYSSTNQRYQGPSPGYGSPETNSMNGFGSGISNTPESTGNNPYGMNVPAQNNPYIGSQQSLSRNTGQLNTPLNKYNNAPIINAFGNMNLEQAFEYGVVTIGYQENAAIVLNRVLMGILAATIPPQNIKQLTDIIYPLQSQSQQLALTSKLNDEIDPLYAVTLADLWARSAYSVSTRQGVYPYGDNGHWNDTLCPTKFKLERTNSQFTTAELLGGIDGFNLGMLRRQFQQRRNMRLSELLRLYYSKDGFKPNFAEVSVCNRASGLNSHLDDLKRQTENYYRLLEMQSPLQDMDILKNVQVTDSFKDHLRREGAQYAPPFFCSDESYTKQNYQCEIHRADVVLIIDSSSQADEAFMSLTAAKLSRKLGISRYSGSLTLLTNQKDMTGSASFNPIIKNSTNTAEIGCALLHDSTSSNQGGQITDPLELMRMFEQTLINLDPSIHSQSFALSSSASSPNYRMPFITSLSEYPYDNILRQKSPDGSKAILWFNYGSSLRPSPLNSYPQQTLNYPMSSYSGYGSNDIEYRFQEAKRNFRENFVGAALIALGTNREELKKFVYDEEKDIIEIPPSSGSTSDFVIYPDPFSRSDLNGPTDQLVERLISRLCDVPAEFQYMLCRRPSNNEVSVGYISQGKTQNWIMAPKTFFSSTTVRMTFRVEGGRLRVCFGRMPRPDENASKSGYMNQLPMSTNLPQGNAIAASSSSNNYYTGLDSGLCKDVSSNQEIEFVVDDPCWKSSIAECKPFYFVIRETSAPGEIDPNWVCKDEACKRLDQVKFTMTHTGVACSSGPRTISSSFFFVIFSSLIGLWFNNDAIQIVRRSLNVFRSNILLKLALPILFLYISFIKVEAQQAGVYDFGEARYGEKRGNFTPAEVLAIVLLVMVILGGLAFTIGLCYYISKGDKQGMTRLSREDHA